MNYAIIGNHAHVSIIPFLALSLLGTTVAPRAGRRQELPRGR